MIDQNQASKLAREAFDLWQAGKLDESAAKYQQGFLLADPDHYAVTGQCAILDRVAEKCLHVVRCPYRVQGGSSLPRAGGH
jgi:hypothetical protein